MRFLPGCSLSLIIALSAHAQTAQPTAADRQTNPSPSSDSPPSPARLLLGQYGPYRANNDLLHYSLTLRVDPATNTIKGDNQVRFRMLQDGARIQLDLAEQFDMPRILFRGKPVKFTREAESFFIDFPQTLRRGQIYTVDVFYGGTPRTAGRFGGMSFEKTQLESHGSLPRARATAHACGGPTKINGKTSRRRASIFTLQCRMA